MVVALFLEGGVMVVALFLEGGEGSCALRSSRSSRRRSTRSKAVVRAGGEECTFEGCSFWNRRSVPSPPVRPPLP